MKVSHFFAHWTQIRSELLVTIDKFGDDELSFAPNESSWPAGKIMLHIGDAEDHWFRYGIQRKVSRSQSYELEEYPDKAAIKRMLAEIHSRTESYLSTLALADLEREIDMPWNERYKLGWIIWHVVEHEIHHRGELSLMLSLLGRQGLDV
jgi:uncharacterized damage-inducible protein DinB